LFFVVQASSLQPGPGRLEACATICFFFRVFRSFKYLCLSVVIRGSSFCVNGYKNRHRNKPGNMQHIRSWSCSQQRCAERLCCIFDSNRPALACPAARGLASLDKKAKKTKKMDDDT